MAAEAVLAIGAGIAARSVLLTAFGLDSVIELLSGVTLLWRLSSEGRGSARVEIVERRATVISSALLVLLTAYLVLVGLFGIATRLHPSGSALGVAVSAAAVIAMPRDGLESPVRPVVGGVRGGSGSARFHRPGDEGSARRGARRPRKLRLFAPPATTKRRRESRPREVFFVNRNSPKKSSARFKTGDMLHQLQFAAACFFREGRVHLRLGLVTSSGGRRVHGGGGVTSSAHVGGVR